MAIVIVILVVLHKYDFFDNMFLLLWFFGLPFAHIERFSGLCDAILG